MWNRMDCIMDSIHSLFLPLVFSLFATLTLVTLSVIDFRTWILPDWLNSVLAFLGFAFHFSTGFIFLTPLQLLYGVLTGGSPLPRPIFRKQILQARHSWSRRCQASWRCGCLARREGVILAMTVGAFAGLIRTVSWLRLFAESVTKPAQTFTADDSCGTWFLSRDFCCRIMAIFAVFSGLKNKNGELRTHSHVAPIPPLYRGKS